MSKKSVDDYLVEKPQWRDELEQLRAIILASGLEETVKWGAPCYMHDGQNVVALCAFKAYFGLWFYLGARLDDTAGVLINAQEGKTQDLRQWRMTSGADIQPELLGQYLEAARALAASGEKLSRRAPAEDVSSAELNQALEKNTKAAAAFAALTPGKQREYAAHIRSAKREATRQKRVEDAIPLILAGKGLNDRYR